MILSSTPYDNLKHIIYELKVRSHTNVILYICLYVYRAHKNTDTT